ncbi:MAG: pseudomurein-binding repeat-containing protein [Methanobacterium sp.]
MECPKCQHKNDEDALYCEKCGTSLKKPKKNGKSINTILIIGIVVLIAILGISVGYIFKGTPTSQNSNQAQVQISESTGFPVSEVPNLAAEISKSNGNIQSVQYKGVTLDVNQCFYIFSKGIVMINNGEKGYIPIKSVKSADAPSGMLSSATLSKSEYVDMAGRTSNWIDTNSQVPNYIGIITPGSQDLSPDLVFKGYMKALTEYKNTGQLPQSVSIP